LFPPTEQLFPSWASRFASRCAPAALYLAAVFLYAQKTLGDGYDGVGFVLALQKFDLERFAPQPPGYPLFVALGRLCHALGHACCHAWEMTPAVALAVVNALLLGAGIAAGAAAIRKAAGAPAGWLFLGLFTLSPLAFALGIATLSDGAGLGVLLLALGCFALNSPAALCASGALIGMALGIRPTYAPLALLLFLLLAIPSRWRALLRIGACMTLAVLGWLIPFLILIGPKTLWLLSRAHLQGHLSLYGGTLESDPEVLARLSAMLTGLCEASFGRFSAFCGLLAAGLCGAALWVRPPRAMPPAARRLCGYLLSGLSAYLLFALLAVSVRGHGRHLLPAVAGLFALVATLLGPALSVSRQPGRAAFAVGIALLFGLLGSGSISAIRAFRQPSPGASLAEYVVAQYPKGTLLYGASGARYLDLRWGSGSAHQTLYFGDVIVEAERMNHLPREVLVTSEVQASSQRQLHPIKRFCYAPQVLRVLRLESYPNGCVDLLSYRFRP
jgi:hypothetical protein